MTPAAAHDSRLFDGGPPRNLARLLGLGSGVAPRQSRAALLGVLVGWMPLALLAGASSAGFGAPALGSFLGDFAVHARQLVAVPLLILADAVCARRLNAIAAHFLDAGLVEDPQRARFEAALSSTRQWVHSTFASIVLLALAYALSLWLLRSVPPTAYPAWQLPAEGAGVFPGDRSIAGWWHALVSLPLLLLLILGWLWRLWLWARLLWLISRMDLHLISSHPDRCAGLRFTGYSLRAFAIVALALGCVGAGRVANSVAHLGVSPFAHRDDIVIGTVVVVALFLAPLLVFSPRLLAEWRRGVFEYGALADRLGRSLERKWFEAGRASDERGLEVQDFSAVVDAYSIVAGVHLMRLVPVDWKSIGVLAGAVLLPFVPLAFLTLPLDTIFRALARFFV